MDKQTVTSLHWGKFYAIVGQRYPRGGSCPEQSEGLPGGRGIIVVQGRVNRRGGGK